MMMPPILPSGIHPYWILSQTGPPFYGAVHHHDQALGHNHDPLVEGHLVRLVPPVMIILNG